MLKPFGPQTLSKLLTKDLSIFLLLNEQYGNPQDLTSNNITATLTSGAAWSVSEIGPAISLDGTNDLIDIGGLTRLEEGTPHTIFGCFNANDASVTGANAYTLFGSGKGTSADRVGLVIHSSALTYGIYDGGSYVNADSGGVSSATWTNFCVTYDGLNSTLYINGVKQVGTSTPLLDSGNNVYIGRGVSGASKEFAGEIGCFGVYSRNVSQDEARILSFNPYVLLEEKSRFHPWAAAVGGGPTIPVMYHHNQNQGFA